LRRRRRSQGRGNIPAAGLGKLGRRLKRKDGRGIIFYFFLVKN